MKGFLLSFLCNLIFSTELVVLAVIAFLLHMFLDFPIAIAYVFLGLWIVIALFVTAGLGVLSKSTPPAPYQKNVNPYSKTTKDFVEKSPNIDEGSDD